MWDWTGPAGFFVGVLGVGVSSGAWIWAWRAERRAGDAEEAANEAKAAVESLEERFQREATETPSLVVLRIGSGASVVNKTAHRLRSVLVAPLGTQVRMDDWPTAGALDAGQSGVVEVAETDPFWLEATKAVVYWVNDDGHRRVNVFPIVEVDSAELNGLVP